MSSFPRTMLMVAIVPMYGGTRCIGDVPESQIPVGKSAIVLIPKRPEIVGSRGVVVNVRTRPPLDKVTERQVV